LRGDAESSASVGEHVETTAAGGVRQAVRWAVAVRYYQRRAHFLERDALVEAV
jgi:hypothetical protein